jgi:cell division protein FtsB
MKSSPTPLIASAAGHDRPMIPHRRRESPWMRRALVFVTCVLLADALIGDRGLLQTIRAQREYQQAAAALRQLQEENAALRDQSRQLVEDPRIIEAVAREELGLIRPGEILVVVKIAR